MKRKTKLAFEEVYDAISSLNKFTEGELEDLTECLDEIHEELAKFEGLEDRIQKLEARSAELIFATAYAGVVNGKIDLNFDTSVPNYGRLYTAAEEAEQYYQEVRRVGVYIDSDWTGDDPD